MKENETNSFILWWHFTFNFRLHYFAVKYGILLLCNKRHTVTPNNENFEFVCINQGEIAQAGIILYHRSTTRFRNWPLEKKYIFNIFSKPIFFFELVVHICTYGNLIRPIVFSRNGILSRMNFTLFKYLFKGSPGCKYNIFHHFQLYITFTQCKNV